MRYYLPGRGREDFGGALPRAAAEAAQGGRSQAAPRPNPNPNPNPNPTPSPNPNKVVELKQHLASRGLGVSGRKDVLVARLEAAIITAQTEAMSLQAEALTPTSAPNP